MKAFACYLIGEIICLSQENVLAALFVNRDYLFISSESKRSAKFFFFFWCWLQVGAMSALLWLGLGLHCHRRHIKPLCDFA